MSFPEPLRLLVRQRAHFRCCVCRAVGVEIHHIIPQEEGGVDTEDNAAPLCPSCHEIYGANRTKRKFIREARDYWYQTCANGLVQGGLTLAELNTAMEPIATKSDIEEIKEQLSGLLEASQQVGVRRSDEFHPVPLERYIRSLYEEDFGNKEPPYDLLFDSRFWYEDDEASYDLLDRRAFFLKMFGEETAKRLCLIACKETGFDAYRFSEKDLVRVIHGLHVAVVLITGHHKFVEVDEAFECVVRPNGEFAWSLVGTKKRRRKPQVKSNKLARPSSRTR